MAMSMKSLSKSVSKSFKLDKVYKNDLYTNIALFVTIALAVNYISQKQYKTLVFLAVFGGAGFLLSKNLMYSLVFTIVVTNLLVSMKYVEGMSEDIDDAPTNNPHKNKNNSKIRKSKKSVNDITELVSQTGNLDT